MYYVYVLRDSVNKKFYIGFTSNLEKRINEHKSGQVYTTKRYQEVNLIFYEVFTSKVDVLRREKYFKTTKGKRALKIMLEDSLKDK